MISPYLSELLVLLVVHTRDGRPRLAPEPRLELLPLLEREDMVMTAQ